MAAFKLRKRIAGEWALGPSGLYAVFFGGLMVFVGIRLRRLAGAVRPDAGESSLPRSLKDKPDFQEASVATERRYTLEQVAAEIGMREDDLATTLPDVGIDLALPGHEDGKLSEIEVDQLDHFLERAKQFDNPLSDIRG